MEDYYYLHMAHLKDIRVVRGGSYEKGHTIGTVGDSGSPGASHLHFEVQKVYRPTQYTTGLSKSEVQDLYLNPYLYLAEPYTEVPLPNGKVTGWDWLQLNNKGQIHPGIDLNVGSGYDDYGHAIHLPENGECVYVGRDEGGWGNHLLFKVLNPMIMDEVNALKTELANLKKEFNTFKQEKRWVPKKVFKDTKGATKGKLFWKDGSRFRADKAIRAWLMKQGLVEDKNIKPKI